MNKQRLWIVTELFPPDETSTSYIMGEIANRLVRKYDVGVICGPEVYDVRKTLDPANKFVLNPSIVVKRVKIEQLDKNTLLGKALRMILLTKKLYSLVKRNVKSGDKVLMVTNPATLVVAGSRFCHRHGCQLNLLVHDVFPENTVPAGIKIPKFAYNKLKNIFDKAYSRSHCMIALGRDMRDILREKTYKHNPNLKIEIIENWADTEEIKPKHSPDDDNVAIQYAGNIGRVQGIQNFVDVFIKANNKTLAMDLWGTGSEEHSLKELVKTNGIQNIEFHGPYFRSQQNDVLNDCDIALVILAEGMLGLGVPSKTYNILAAGKPVLYIGDSKSEIALCIRENNLGFVFEPSQKKELIEFLRSIKSSDKEHYRRIGIRCREVAEQKYSKEVILDKFLAI